MFHDQLHKKLADAEGFTMKIRGEVSVAAS
jgi:hypothetical protein